MREPPMNVRVLGHPLVAVPIGLGGMAFLYLCWQGGGEALLPAIITMVVMAWVGKAHDHMNGYRAWKRAWDAMAEPRARKPSAGGWRKPLGVVVIALVAVYVAAHADQPDYHLALSWMVLVAIIASVVGLWRMIRGGKSAARRRKAGGDAVRIVAKPVMKVPSLDAAYQALPDYCHRLLGA